MRQFYKQVRVDETQMRFYAECPLCKKRHYTLRLPMLCRRKDLLESFERGEGTAVQQKIYNKSKVFAIGRLVRLFNFCPKCGKWVCDDCFDIDLGHSICQSDTSESCQ